MTQHAMDKIMITIRLEHINQIRCYKNACFFFDPKQNLSFAIINTQKEQIFGDIIGLLNISILLFYIPVLQSLQNTI